MSKPLDEILGDETPVSDDAVVTEPEAEVKTEPEANPDAQPPEEPVAEEEEPKEWSYHAYKDEKTKRKEWETKATEAEARAAEAERQAQAVAQQMQQFQEQFQQQNPQGHDIQQYVGQQVASVEAKNRLNMSKMLAVREHGQEKVTAAEQAFYALQATDPVSFGPLFEQFGVDADPIGQIVKWHARQETLSKLGDDPDAYIEAQVQARLAELQGVQPGQTPAPAVDPAAMPTDLSQSRNVGSRTASNWSGPAPLSDILGE